MSLECSRPEAGGTRHSLANVDRIRIGRSRVRRAERIIEGAARTLAIGVPDPRMSSEHAVIVRAEGCFTVADLGSRNGTRVNGATVTRPIGLTDGELLELGHTLFRFRSEIRSPAGEAADADSASIDPEALFSTLDPVLSARASKLARVARSGSPVLILGETGTGKEVLARAIHRCSGRRGAFVAVNCGALPAALVEAQLFGHVRGAFSGAVGDAEGLLRSADGGTLLLDEIGDLPKSSQVALLRALQEREVVPVGAVRPIRIDLRIVAATHRPLERLVAEDEFRSDLYARLAGFTFLIPPLRERREDVGLMIAAFASGTQVRFTLAAARALLAYDWPLNVRELHQSLKVAAALSAGGTIDLGHLPDAVTGGTARPRVSTAERRSPSAAIREDLILSLKRNGGNVSETARELGKARMQVQRWMKRFGIDARSFR